MNRKDIVDAWARIREIDHTIPDDVLDFMKDAAIEKIERYETLQANEAIKEKAKQIELTLENYININRKDLNNDDIIIGGWNCESYFNPIDSCCYDISSDMGDDECIFCGQPNERK